MEASIPRFVTFDAAQTLLEVNWDPGQVLLRALRTCAIECDVQVTLETYIRLVHSRWSDYKQRNLQRNHALAESWWREIAHELARRQGWSEEVADRLVATADHDLYRPDGEYFRLFPDTRPCLARLQELGIPCGVISNWDFSLHRLLRVHDLDQYFEFVLCSDEEGYQKPDGTFFAMAVDRAGVPAKEILHVGDNPLDDVQGALGAGMQAVLIDRESSPGPMRVNTLAAIPRVFE
jgi:putative hydrolase of the HAD superfamily